MTIMSSGKVVSQDNNEVPTVDDIARGLSRQIRFAGQSDIAYSVMQHTFVVAAHVPAHMRAFALLHDATETVMGDTPRPWKHPHVTMLENDLQERISRSFGLPYPWPPHVHEAVHKADMAAACAEALLLFGEPAREWCQPWVEPTPEMHRDLLRVLPMGGLWFADSTPAASTLRRELRAALLAWKQHIEEA